MSSFPDSPVFLPEGVHRGNALELLSRIEPNSVDAVITDPPYSSGGRTTSERQREPSAKYQQSQSVKWLDFSGDNRDQRSWTWWMSLWLSLALPAVRPGGYVIVFTDWRQLPATTDALQAGGWVWRGIVPWDKTESSRAPHTGYFRHQAEYAVWGTRGTSLPSQHGGPWPGVFRAPKVRPSDRHHMTTKPVEVMRHLVQAVPPGGLVLDPFCGSGSTGVACKEAGRRFIGLELVPEYAAVARRRIEAAQI